MSDRSRERTFWAGLPGPINVVISEKHKAEKLQYDLGKARILAEYEKMKRRDEG